MFPLQKIKANSHHSGKPWAYPPLPPNHTVALKKVSFSNATLNFANGDESSSSFNYFQNSNSRVKRIINKYDANEYDHESSDCESICLNDTEFEEKLEKKFIDAEEQTTESCLSRMRGGCGGGCSCAGDEAPLPQRSCRKLTTLQDATDREQNCAPQVQSRSPSPAGTSCCPTVGSRPTYAKPQSRCNSPCRSDGPGCGLGGCCGTSGCRGGCGKPGQTCRPNRTCGGSTFYRDNSFVSRSHWSLAKSDSPHPVSARSQSRVQNTCGRSDTSVNEQFRTPKNEGFDDDCKQLTRSKSGCECLGGGLDCQRCGRKVYQAEMMLAAGSPYHTICFSCYCCRKPLEPLTYQENCGEIYCKQCLIRNFGPQGYGYGAGAGVLQTPI